MAVLAPLRLPPAPYMIMACLFDWSTSFGKGSVQEVGQIKYGGELKVTIAHWYRPDGKNINHIGITPDETVQLTPPNSAAGNDTQENAAISYINSQLMMEYYCPGSDRSAPLLRYN